MILCCLVGVINDVIITTIVNNMILSKVRYGHGAAVAGSAGSRVVTDDMTAENTTSTALMVDRLELNVDYKFLVRAYTSKGPGPWSNRLPFRTLGHCKCLTPSTVILSL